MKFIVFRHGEAELSFDNDKARQLTPRGRAQISQAFQARQEDISAANLLIHSPYVRAWQSAELIGAQLQQTGVSVDTLCVNWIQPGSAPNEAVDHLYSLLNSHMASSSKSAEIETVVMVTHLPFVASFIEYFCGLDRGAVTMGTASVVCIDTDVIAKGCGSILWQDHAN